MNSFLHVKIINLQSNPNNDGQVCLYKIKSKMIMKNKHLMNTSKVSKISKEKKIQNKTTTTY